MNGWEHSFGGIAQVYHPKKRFRRLVQYVVFPLIWFKQA